MAYPVTVYPLVGSVWKTPLKPSANPFSFTNVAFQLYVDPHWTFPVPTAGALINYVPVMIKTPPTLHVYNRNDIIQPDTGVAEYYLVGAAEHIFKGFPQAFDALYCFQCNANGTVPRTY